MPGSVEEQTLNIQETLESCRSALDKVVKVTVRLSDMAHFQTFNNVYRACCPDGFPARTSVVSKLAFDLDVEIEIQALA